MMNNLKSIISSIWENDVVQKMVNAPDDEYDRLQEEIYEQLKILDEEEAESMESNIWSIVEHREERAFDIGFKAAVRLFSEAGLSHVKIRNFLK